MKFVTDAMCCPHCQLPCCLDFSLYPGLCPQLGCYCSWEWDCPHPSCCWFSGCIHGILLCFCSKRLRRIWACACSVLESGLSPYHLERGPQQGQLLCCHLNSMSRMKEVDLTFFYFLLSFYFLFDLFPFILFLETRVRVRVIRSRCHTAGHIRWHGHKSYDT